MRLERLERVALVGMMLILAVGCSDGGTEPGTEETVLLSLIPQGGATGVDPNAPVVIRFSHPMMQGMEEYVDVHEGAVEGPLVPGAW
ncbi:MAG: Ig-like domain-containing protein, partial [Longimicrobiales bacterium]